MILTWAVYYVLGYVKEREGHVVGGPPSCCGCVGWIGREKEKFHIPRSATKRFIVNLTMNVSGILSQHLQVEVLAPSRGHIMLCRIWISYDSAYPNRITLNISYSLYAGVRHPMTTDFFRCKQRRCLCSPVHAGHRSCTSITKKQRCAPHYKSSRSMTSVSSCRKGSMSISYRSSNGRRGDQPGLQCGVAGIGRGGVMGAAGAAPIAGA